MTPRADFTAGNTRLRARLPGLLGQAEYESLSALPRDAAVERLTSTIYRAYPTLGEDAEGHLLRAVGQRLRDVLGDVRRLYVGSARSVVGVLLARHDLHDTLALLRGARGGKPTADRLSAVMGVGELDRRAAADIGAADDGATAVLRLAAHHLPDPLTAHVLPAAWDRFELSSDPDEFEATVASTAITGWLTRLERAGRAARPVLELVREECDRSNLLAVLRDSAVETPHLLPVGAISLPALLAARRGDPTAVLAARPGWSAALDRQPYQPDLSVLEWDLEMAHWRQAVRQIRRGDPLGADVPVGYVVAAECEARVVRILLSSTANRHDVRELLIT
jgi:vacuolar-type H+-ATPase subunit C/Vma6